MGSSFNINIPVGWGGEWVTRRTLLESLLQTTTAPEDDVIFCRT
jgi:hypothetical protein